MSKIQGSLELLNDPIAQELLRLNIPARLAYFGQMGRPALYQSGITGMAQVLYLPPPKPPKLKAPRAHPRVALTIDDNTFPHKVLMLRGTASIEEVDGIVPEYALAATRVKRGNCMAQANAPDGEPYDSDQRSA